MICDNGMATSSPVYLFKHVKHGTQNIESDYHQRLSGSFKCTKFIFGRDSAPDPSWEAYRAPDLLACLRRPCYSGRGGTGGRRERGRKGRTKTGGGTPFANSWIRLLDYLTTSVHCMQFCSSTDSNVYEPHKRKFFFAKLSSSFSLRM